MGIDLTFIIGAPRSGSSMLYYYVAAHPDVAYPDMGLERMMARRWVRRLDRAGVPVLRSRLLHRRYLPEPGSLRYEAELRFLGLDPMLPREGQAILWHDLIAQRGASPSTFPGSAAARDPTMTRRLRSRYAAIARREDVRHVVDKAPRFTTWLDAIARLDRGARILHIVRDGRAVVNSLVYGLRSGRRGDVRYWGPRPRNWRELKDADDVERACHQWLDLVRRARTARDRYGLAYLEVRYERLCAEPRGVMGEIFSFMGLEPGDLTRYPSTVEDRNHKWRAEPGSEFDDPIWTAAPAIRPEERRHFAIMRPELESLGYLARETR